MRDLPGCTRQYRHDLHPSVLLEAFKINIPCCDRQVRKTIGTARVPRRPEQTSRFERCQAGPDEPH